MWDISAEIKSNIEVGPNVFLLEIAAPDISISAQPGQFCMLRPGNIRGYDPLLRRPLSIHQVNRQDYTIRFLYKVVGRGTTALARQRPGEVVHTLGPLGKGFETSGDMTPILIGGGLGVAPLLFLAQNITSPRGIIILGAVTRDQLLRVKAFEETGHQVMISTDDGTLGKKGFVTQLFMEVMEKMADSARTKVCVFACGPLPMLKSLVDLCNDLSIRCQVSLETTMACGSGLCLGCAIPGATGYLHVCKDGPCFWTHELDWSTDRDES